VGAGIGKISLKAQNCEKYSAYPFLASRSDRAASFNFWQRNGQYKRKDGEQLAFPGGGYQATENWTQITIPFDKFKRRSGIRYWDKQKQEPVKLCPAAIRTDEEDYAGIDSWNR